MWNDEHDDDLKKSPKITTALPLLGGMLLTLTKFGKCKCTGLYLDGFVSNQQSLCWNTAVS